MLVLFFLKGTPGALTHCIHFGEVLILLQIQSQAHLKIFLTDI